MVYIGFEKHCFYVIEQKLKNSWKMIWKKINFILILVDQPIQVVKSLSILK